MSQGRESHSKRFDLNGLLRAVSLSSAANPKLVLAMVMLASILCAVSAGVLLKFKTNRADLIDPDAEFHKRWMAYIESFGDGSDVVVVVEGKTPTRIIEVIEDLGAQFQSDSELFEQVFFKYDPAPLRQKGLQYISKKQLEDGLQGLSAFQPVLRGGWEKLKLGTLSEGLTYQLTDGLQILAKDPADPKGQHQFGAALVQLNLLAKSLDGFVDTHQFTSPWPELMQVDPELQQSFAEVRYNWITDAQTMAVIKVKPLKKDEGFTGKNRSIDRARELVATAKSKYTDCWIGLTGIPVLESDEMHRTQSDMTIASVLSFFGCWALLVIGFRGMKHPLLAMIMLGVGTIWCFGFTTFAIGHLNILSVSFAAILFGLGIDYAVVFLAHYLEERHHGRGLLESVAHSAANVGDGIVTAAVTTATAFFCASFSDFKGVSELGIIGGSGVLLCLLANFLVLPALIAIADKNVEARALPNQFEGTLWRRLINRHPYVIGITSAACVAGLGACAFERADGVLRLKVKYDYNLLNLQAEGIESVETQKRIFRAAEEHTSSGKGSLLYAVSLANSAEEARALKARFKKLPTVGDVEELGSGIPIHSSEDTTPLVQVFQQLLSRLPRQAPQTGNVVPKDIGETLEEVQKLLMAVDQPLAKETVAAIDRCLDHLDNYPTAQQVEVLTRYQTAMVTALLTQLQMAAASADPEPISINDFPTELSSRFVSGDGKWLVQIYPKNSIWDIDPLKQFVDDVRTVDPNATGTPIQNYEASQQFVSSFLKAAVYAFIAVMLILIMDFLGHRLTIQALVPTIVIVACIALSQRLMNGLVDWRVLAGSFAALWIPLVGILNWKSLVYTFMAMSPCILGAAVMYGSMALFRVDLNPANLIVLPLILGIGVDVGVHVVHDFRHHTKGRYEMSGSTFNSIILTTTTSIVGFGSMMVSAHRGLYSLGLVLSIGLSGTLFVAVVLLPAILTVFRDHMSPTDEDDDEESAAVTTENSLQMTDEPIVDDFGRSFFPGPGGYQRRLA